MAYRKYRSGGGRPKARGLTAAQQKAHDEAYAACDHTVDGRHNKGDVLADYKGGTWKVVTYGIRYHEDVSNRIYGVQPCRGPKGWAETCELRRAIEAIRMKGTRTVADRVPEGIPVGPRPESPAVATWRDGRAGSLASFPELTIYEGGIVGVYCPVYDDSPIVAWIRDVALAKRLAKAIAACPSPVHLPEVNVRERRIKLTIGPDHPRFSAYAAARDAKPIRPWITAYPVTEAERAAAATPEADRPVTGLDLPSSEWRRIKAELDAAGVTP